MVETTTSLRELTAYIVERHHEFLKLNLPRLRKQLQEVRQAHSDGPHPKLDRIEATFCDLYEELTMHLHKEEMILFPAIEALERAKNAGVPSPRFPFGSIDNPAAMMEMEHDHATQAIDTLREITNGYQAGCGTCKEFIAGLKALDEDLREHIRVENEVLHPRARALEL